MKTKNIKVGWILINSQSNEYKISRLKELSINSGHKIKFISSVDVYLENNKSGNVILVSVKNNKMIDVPDFAISLIPDEKFDIHAYKILEFLESKNVRILNSVKSCRLATDKFKANILLSKNGFEVPETILFSKFTNIKPKKFPLIVKPVDGRKGRGVKIIESLLELREYQKNTNEDVLVLQELIDSFGKDIRVYILNGECIGATRREKIQNDLITFNTNKIEINEDMRLKSIKIAKLFDLNFCCIDYFLDKKNTICEVNANPGYKNFEKYISNNLSELMYLSFNNKN
ncbi:hypothetical protein KA089_00525 [Candidatus Woesebacteria bacterium]|nr:hypothetical protein [Candidatus Woesebacteria bacterium]